MSGAAARTRLAAGLRGGWGTVAALSVTETVSWGILYYAFAVVLEPMEREFGWTRLQLTAAFSLALLASALGGVAVGRWLDGHGPRGLMTVGSACGAGLVFAWSQVGELATLYAIWIGIGLCMAMVLYEPAFTVIAKWFGSRRRRAMTAITLAAGFATTVFSPLTEWLVTREGWRGALMVLALILAAITVPLHALALRQPSAEREARDAAAPLDPAAAGGCAVDPAAGGGYAAGRRGQDVSAGSALRSASFWLLTVAFFLANFNVAAMGVHLVVLLIGRGYGAGFAATAAGLVGAMQVLGRIVFGPLTTRLPRAWGAFALFLFQAAGLAVLVQPLGAGAVIVFTVLFGMGNGMITLARPMLLAEAYGARHFGTISGVAALFATGARAVAPVLVSFVYALTGGYRTILWALMAGALAAGAAGFLSVRRAEREHALSAAMTVSTGAG